MAFDRLSPTSRAPRPPLATIDASTWLSRRRWRAAVILAAWSVSVLGLWMGSTGPLAIAVLGLASATWLSVLRTQRQVEADELRRRLSIGQLFGLLGLTTDVGPLPALEGAAISVEGAHALAMHVATHRPMTIVELGPGASTAIVHRAASVSGYAPQVFSVEHDRAYAAVARELVSRLAMSSTEVIEAPLESQSTSAWTGLWYSRAGVARLPTGVDLLIVDGPPAGERADARSPALDLLADRLADGAYVYVDDTHRPGEKSILARWLVDFPCSVVWAGETFTMLRWTAANESG